MKSKMNLFAEASPHGFLRFAFAVVAFTALTLCGSVSFAEDEPAEASKPAASGDAAPYTGCSTPGEHPHDDPTVCPVEKTKVEKDKTGSSGASDLASKLSNPSAPMMAMQSFVDIKQNGGSLQGAHRASMTYSFQPAFPFPTKRGNVIFRPLIPIEFGAPYLTAAGTIDTYVGFGNISLDTLYGKTLKKGLMIMGGFSTLFGSSTKSETRAWGLGPEAVLGFASPKTGNVWGALAEFTWSFPTRANGQNLGLQYFYAINIRNGWQIGAQPVISYSRESKVLRVPLGIGFSKVAVFGTKKHQPVKLGAQLWAYTPPPGGSGPEWTLRFTIAPVIPLPWGK